MMKRLLALTLLAAATSSLAAPRPNILYLYVDDMGWGSIGPNAQADRAAKGLPRVQTPNLDQLAANGVNFTRGYGCTVCSPARSSQQSGFHQGHTFADANNPNNAMKALRTDDVLMGDALAEAGYVTGYWGKWGYGGSADKQNPTIDNVQTLPTTHGYKHVLAELHHVRAHTFFQPTLWSAPAKPGAIGGIELKTNSMAPYRGKNYPQTPAFQTDPAYPKTAYCDDTYAFAALDFVRNQAQHYNKTGHPFFGLFAAQIPHAPFGEISKLPKWNNSYAADPHFAKLAQQSQQWAAMVTRIDAHFGNLIAALDDPNNDGDTSDSVAKDTLVIFQSDNGGPGGPSNKDYDANGGLRGSKGSIYEGGIRVPLVMSWPGTITKKSPLKLGTSTGRIVDVTDLLPTFCELAGKPAPAGIDGVSIAPSLTGEGIQREREYIIHEAGGSSSIIRGKHKLVLSKASPKKKKKAGSPAGVALYDLVADHAEKKNIAANRPQLVNELKALLIGERVLEPKGFANTYHRWTGKNGSVTSKASNWSDYVYANAGVTYTTDDGAPQLSWNASMTNPSKTPSTAKVDKDLELLSLHIKGRSAQATQTLAVGRNASLNGRNEIRLDAHARLEMRGATVSSQRWVDVMPQATLSGSGTVDTSLFNNGSVLAGGLAVSGDYTEESDARLTTALTDGLSVKGDASLSGTLAVSVKKGQPLKPGQQFTVLKADSIQGTFNNANNELALSGTRFKIGYSNTEVTLTVL